MAKTAKTSKRTKTAVKKKAARKAAPKAASRPARKPARKPAKKKVSYMPKGYHTAVPYLTVSNTREAIAFYKKAFGAKERAMLTGPGGSVMHAEISIGDSIIMMGDGNPGMGMPTPEQLGGSASGIMLYVKDADAVFAAAINAGATILMPLDNQFWGDRYGQLKDPFGHKWSIATHLEDMSIKEMQRRGDAFMAQFTS